MLEIRADQKDYSAYTLLISNEEKGRIPREEIGLYLLYKEKTLADTNNFLYSFSCYFYNRKEKVNKRKIIMIRNLILLMLLLLFPVGLSAEGFVSEWVFVYPVKSYCQIGDSVEMKGHVLSEDSTFVSHSRYLYLDVIHGDSLVYKQHLRCGDSGTFHTRFYVPPTWKADVYHIRAYTRFMRNYSSRSFPMIPLQIGEGR